MHCFIYSTETEDEKKKIRDFLIQYHEENKDTIKYTVISELIGENLEDVDNE